MLLNPKQNKYEHLDARSRQMMLKTIEFFETKGKVSLKDDYEKRVWYTDFLDFLKKEKIFAHLLTPSRYGDANCRWDTFRNCDFNEILGFYGIPYWYAWQVTILGLGPIWMGQNEEVKKQTARLLDQGLHDARVAVALVDGRVGRQAIQVLLPVDVVDPHALPALDHHVERVVVVGPVLLFQFDECRCVRLCRLHGNTCRMRNRGASSRTA